MTINHRFRVRPRPVAFAGALVCGVLLLGATGCGKIAEKASEKVLEKGIEAGTGGKVNIDADGGKLSFENEEGSWSFDEDEGIAVETEDGSFRSGMGMPDGWPDDVPLPPGFEPVTGHSMSEEDSTAVGVAGTVDASPEQVMGFYEDALSSWEQSGTSKMSEGDDAMHTASYEHAGRTFSVTAYRDDDGTSVNMQHTAGGDR